MAYQLRCEDAGVAGCDYVAWGETREELMELAASHGKEAHGFEEITPELQKKIEGAIEEV